MWDAGKTMEGRLLSNLTVTLGSSCNAGNAIDLRLARVGE